LPACKKTEPQETIHIQSTQIQEVEYPQESAVSEVNIENEQVNNIMYEPYSQNFNNFFPTVEYEPVSEEIYDILYASEERYLERRVTEILFIHKVNFGVPGGDNYIVLWKGVKDGSYAVNRIILYSISDKIEKRYMIGEGFGLNNTSYVNTNNLDIMEGIPGIHIGDFGASVFDCNGDGKDELFAYVFSGRINCVGISGYDPETDKIAWYCDDIGFEVLDKDKGPVPVEFTQYKNRIGFKVCHIIWGKFPPVNVINDYYAWYFYVWNGVTKEYECIGEYQEDEAIYNIHAFDLEHFKNRLKVQVTSNMVGLVDLVEINANIQGGRSFKATFIAGSTKEHFQEIYDFNSEGILVNGSYW
jgi:hypothetical protein